MILPEKFHFASLIIRVGIVHRPGVVRVLEEFKIAVYGENHDQEEADSMSMRGSRSEASRKRKEMAETAERESSRYNWADLAESGQVRIQFSV